MTTIHLGFEVGTGAPVAIPLRHLAITGQTQESGKTTTLEALVARSGLPAIAFVTKRGEGSFADGRRIAPYFRDRADWQFVDQLLAAQLREKNKFLRPWIIKICRHTRTLADVQRAVKDALGKAKGFNEGIYTQLDAYLELIVPEIGRAPLADRIELGPGVNVMDLSGYTTPMQMLFVQSAIDWVNEREHGVVTIIPEAWEFIPQNGGSPVKASATALIRKGAGIGNFLFADSQDMAGVDNVILRGCAVWLIGVQREANEIKRNLANIPASVARPTAADVATLQRGEFFVCFHNRVVKTYVQPVWMPAAEAKAVALGATPTSSPPPASRKSESRNAGKPASPPPPPAKEDPSMCQEHQQLQRANEELRREAQRLNEQARTSSEQAAMLTEDVRRLKPLGDAVGLIAKGLAALGIGSSNGSGPARAIDEDALIAKVLARIPAGGAVVQVTPPAKLRADFQKAEAERLLACCAALSALERSVLKLLEAIEGQPLSQRQIAQRLGRSETSGGGMKTLAEAVARLVDLGLIEVDSGRKGYRATTRQRIATDLATYQPTEADIDATYQHVLHLLATGGAD